MRWNKFTLKTKTDAEDIVISALADAGVEGVEIEDKVPLSESDKQQMFVDILPDGPADAFRLYTARLEWMYFALIAVSKIFMATDLLFMFPSLLSS